MLKGWRHRSKKVVRPDKADDEREVPIAEADWRKSRAQAVRELDAFLVRCSFLPRLTLIGRHKTKAPTGPGPKNRRRLAS